MPVKAPELCMYRVRKALESESDCLQALMRWSLFMSFIPRAIAYIREENLCYEDGY
ncbi:hypothetical protein ACTXT7_006777 [Hymenolepis weldensis]